MKSFILTLDCVKMVAWPNYLAANWSAPVVYKDTQSRLATLKESDVLFW